MANEEVKLLREALALAEPFVIHGFECGARTKALDYITKAKNERYANGAPKLAPDGMMLDDQGNRSIFDDVDQ